MIHGSSPQDFDLVTEGVSPIPPIAMACLNSRRTVELVRIRDSVPASVRMQLLDELAVKTSVKQNSGVLTPRPFGEFLIRFAWEAEGVHSCSMPGLAVLGLPGWRSQRKL